MLAKQIKRLPFTGNFSLLMLMTGCNVSLGLINLSLSYQIMNYSDFGVWITIFAIYNWIGTFGGGLGTQTRNQFSLAHRDDDELLKTLIFKETFNKSAVVLMAAWLCWLSVSFVIDWDSVFSENNAAKLLQLVVFLGILNEWLKNANRFLFSIDKGYATVTAALLNNLLILIILSLFVMDVFTPKNLLGSEIVAIALVYTLFAPFLNLAVMIFYFKNLLLSDIRSKGTLLQYKDGFWFVGFKALSGVVLAILPALVMNLSGPNAAGDVGILIRLYSLPLFIVTVFLQHEWLSITLKAFAKNSKKRVIWNTRLSFGLIISILALIVMLSIQNKILSVWLRDDIEMPFVISFIVSLFFGFLVIKRFLVTVLQAINETKKTALISLLVPFALTFFVLLYKSSSAEGIFIAACLALLAEVVMLTLITRNKAYTLHASEVRSA